jgi:hypothetical protein
MAIVLARGDWRRRVDSSIPPPYLEAVRVEQLVRLCHQVTAVDGVATASTVLGVALWDGSGLAFGSMLSWINAMSGAFLLGGDSQNEGISLVLP